MMDDKLKKLEEQLLNEIDERTELDEKIAEISDTMARTMILTQSSAKEVFNNLLIATVYEEQNGMVYLRGACCPYIVTNSLTDQLSQMKKCNLSAERGSYELKTVVADLVEGFIRYVTDNVKAEMIEDDEE